MRGLIIVLFLVVIYSCKEEQPSSELPWRKDSFQSTIEELDMPLSSTLDLMVIVLDENKDTVKDCLVYSISETDSVVYPSDTNVVFVPLPLGQKYLVGFEKEGYIKKHLIVDVIETGDPENAEFGFAYPMELHLIPGDVHLPSKFVGQLEYIDSIGDIDNVL